MKKRIIRMLAALLAAGFMLWVMERPPEAQPKTLEPEFQIADEQVEIVPGTNATVLRVVDGDTFVADLDGTGEVKVRMLGVDTPETVDPRKSVQCFGKDASNFTKKLLEGKRVSLDIDPLADERDKYGRLLRIVVLPDGTDVNAELIRQGYAHAYLSFPLDPERKHLYKTLENDAKEELRGLWNPDACNES